MNTYETFTTLVRSSFPWLLEHGISIVIIALGALVIQRFARHGIEKFIRHTVKRGGDSEEAERKREDTLIQVIRGTAVILIWITACLMILSEVGVAIGPLLAAAGIAGLALGFGGQYLIRDLISGVFIVVENQYRAGDIVCFDTTCGRVEHMTLRATTLRDLDGTVHHVPHGEVKKVSNLSKQFARVNLNVGVSYRSDLEKVITVVNAVGEALAEDPKWNAHIITPPQFLRVDDFGDSSIVIKILGDTKPLQQWAVTGELRKRLKIAFDKEGIEIPFPQRVVHMEHSEGKGVTI